MGNQFCGGNLAVTSKPCKRQTIWHKSIKFWYKKRQSILFQKKSIWNLCFLASLRKILTESDISGWWPCIPSQQLYERTWMPVLTYLVYIYVIFSDHGSYSSVAKYGDSGMVERTEVVQLKTSVPPEQFFIWSLISKRKQLKTCDLQP